MVAAVRPDIHKVELAPLIDALGDRTFDATLLAITGQVCGAEHVALYDLREDGPVAQATASPGVASTASRPAWLQVPRRRSSASIPAVSARPTCAT